LFEDMGWYTVNYGTAQPMRFGLNQGCNFVTQPCSQATWGSYFCTDQPGSASNTYCTGERDSIGGCSLTAYSQSLPTGYQYIAGQPTWGGNQYQDFCPTPIGFSNGYCRDEFTSFNTGGFPQIGTTLGPNSMCMDISWPQDSTQRGTCYLVYCAADQQSAQVTIGGANYTCTQGGSINVGSLGNLVVTCPSMAIACPSGNYSNYDVNTWNPAFNQPIGTAPPNIFSPFSLPDNPFQNSSFSGFSLPSMTGGLNFSSFSGFSGFATSAENALLSIGSPLFIALCVIGGVCCCAILIGGMCSARR